eukprot:scaffold46615_cov39-Prasinocladus_malaysianus.AAC.1
MADVVPYLSSFYVNHHTPGWRFQAVKLALPSEKPPRPLGVLITFSDTDVSACAAKDVLRFSDDTSAYELQTQSDYVLFHKVNRDLKCTSGQYLAILRVIVPEDSPEASVVFDSYSENRAKFKLLSHQQLWAELWPSLEVLAAENGETSSYAKWGAPQITRTLWQSASLGLMCMLYSNRSSASELREEISFELDNLELLEGDGQSGRPAGSMSRQIKLSSGQQELLALLWRSSGMT